MWSSEPTTRGSLLFAWRHHPAAFRNIEQLREVEQPPELASKQPRRKRGRLSVGDSALGADILASWTQQGSLPAAKPGPGPSSDGGDAAKVSTTEAEVEAIEAAKKEKAEKKRIEALKNQEVSLTPQELAAVKARGSRAEAEADAELTTSLTLNGRPKAGRSVVQALRLDEESSILYTLDDDGQLNAWDFSIPLRVGSTATASYQQ